MDTPYDSEVYVIYRNENEMKLVQVGEKRLCNFNFVILDAKQPGILKRKDRQPESAGTRELQTSFHECPTYRYHRDKYIISWSLCRVTKFLYTLSVYFSFME